jgi:acetyl-CoA acetyltransferase
VAVFRSLCQGEGHRYGQAGEYNELLHLNFRTPVGMFSPPLMIAPLVQRYIHEFGAKPEHFGEVALVCRENAHRNPCAVMGGCPLTVDDYLNSRMIASQNLSYRSPKTAVQESPIQRKIDELSSAKMVMSDYQK